MRRKSRGRVPSPRALIPLSISSCAVYMFLQAQRLLRNASRWRPPHSRSLTKSHPSGIITIRATRKFFDAGHSRERSAPVQVKLSPRRGASDTAPRSSRAMESSPPESGFAKRLWEANEREAQSALYHPFVVALAAGTLGAAAFERYIAQDAYFLSAFADAYGLAIANTDDADAAAVLRSLRLHVQSELEHVHLPAQRDSEDADSEDRKPSPATLAYTEFLLGVARGDEKFLGGEPLAPPSNSDQEALSWTRRRLAACTIAAMTPCSRLYWFLGETIKNSLDGDSCSSRYSRWIDEYASAEFGRTALDSESLVDRLSLPFPAKSAERALMAQLYKRAMELEVAFFAAQQPLDGPSLVPLFSCATAGMPRFVLASDFDSTCTPSDYDSCPALVDLSISTSSSTQSSRSVWDSLTAEYYREYAELLDRLLSEEGGGARRNAGSPPDWKKVRKVAEDIAQFEVAANARMVGARALKGMSMAAVRHAGAAMLLQDGCEALLRRLSEDGNSPAEVHIVSACWSQTFIEECFAERGLDVDRVQANELEVDEQGVTTGRLVTRIQTALDKEAALAALADLASAEKRFTVFVGDSVTDLLGLLSADIGIVVGRSDGLERVAEACGIAFLPLYAGLLRQQRRVGAQEGGGRGGMWSKFDGVLYRISGWHELHAFLLGS